jgi:hypothetical protein
MEIKRTDIVYKRQQAFIKKLEQFRGHITNTCKALKMCVQSYYSWRSKYPDFAAEADEVLLKTFEDVEQSLLDRILCEEPSDRLLEFYIKSRAHNYMEKGYAPFNTYSMDLTTKGESINEIKIINLTEVKPPEDEENNDN